SVWQSLALVGSELPGTVTLPAPATRTPGYRQSEQRSGSDAQIGLFRSRCADGTSRHTWTTTFWMSTRVETYALGTHPPQLPVTCKTPLRMRSDVRESARARFRIEKFVSIPLRAQHRTLPDDFRCTSCRRLAPHFCNRDPRSASSRLSLSVASQVRSTQFP